MKGSSWVELFPQPWHTTVDARRPPNSASMTDGGGFGGSADDDSSLASPACRMGPCLTPRIWVYSMRPELVANPNPRRRRCDPQP